jgi:hypothetical protein
MKTKRSTILHFWNNGHTSPATIALLTEIPVGAVKYNIAKIKEQGIIEDRTQSGCPLKLTTNESAQKNGLQKYFALCSTNVNVRAQICI